MAFSRIAGMHYCIPSGRLTNEMLEARFDAKALRSIVKMSSIVERRVLPEGRTASDLAELAGKRLLADTGVEADEIDFLLYATQTGDYKIPATACVMHERLGLGRHCGALDIGLGCSAFPYALAVADGLIASGTARRVLVINADALTQVIHPRDRGLVPLHGDGACATLVVKSETGHGLEGVRLGTDGTGHRHLCIPASGAKTPRTAATAKEVTDDTGSVRTDEHLQMNGPAVFHFSAYTMPEVIREAFTSWGRSIADEDLVIFHQANKTMLDLMYRALDVPSEKRFYHMEKIGNTSGAATPIALAEAIIQNRIKPGTSTTICSFGVGLSWGVARLAWDDVLPCAGMSEL